jgi:hypothetical protein
VNLPLEPMTRASAEPNFGCVFAYRETGVSPLSRLAGDYGEYLLQVKPDTTFDLQMPDGLVWAGTGTEGLLDNAAIRHDGRSRVRLFHTYLPACSATAERWNELVI